MSTPVHTERQHVFKLFFIAALLVTTSSLRNCPHKPSEKPPQPEPDKRVCAEGPGRKGVRRCL